MKMVWLTLKSEEVWRQSHCLLPGGGSHTGSLALVALEAAWMNITSHEWWETELALSAPLGLSVPQSRMHTHHYWNHVNEQEMVVLL